MKRRGIGERRLGNGCQPDGQRRRRGFLNPHDEPVWLGQGADLARALVDQVEYHPGGIRTELGGPNTLDHPPPDVQT